MLYTPNDIRKQFDSATYERGVSYQRYDHVVEVKVEGDVIRSLVRGNASRPYRQVINVILQDLQVRFDGECSCPMYHNCKHVVAALLAAYKQAPRSSSPQAQALPLDMLRWLNAVGAQAATAQRRSTIPAAKAAAKPAYRLVYVLMPQPGGQRPQLNLCKGRVAADGVIRSGTLIKDLYRFHNSPPDFMQQEDRLPAATFISLLANIWGSPALALSGAAAAELLQQVAALGTLYWAGDKNDLKSGLQPLQNGPSRAGGLAWGLDQDASTLRLGWRFDEGEPIELILPTHPVMYVQAQQLGPLTLPPAFESSSMTEWLMLVERAPKLAPAHVPQFAQQLLSSSLNGLLPLPELETVVRTDILPKPTLTLGSVTRFDPRAGATMAEFAVLGFEYDGLFIDADPRSELTRVSGQGIETITRQPEQEAALLASLHAVGFHAPVTERLLPGEHPAELHLGGEQDWLRFVSETLPQLQAHGWQIGMTPGFRFDLAAVDDWYASVNQDGEDTGSAWLELELGIVVNGQSVPLLPVLLQLIRQAPQAFERAALDARSDDEMLLATLPGGANVALPWGRVKPILHTLGELYFKDQVGDVLQLPALDMARLAELEASAQLRWIGGERLRALGHKLNAFERVQAVAAPKGLQASLRPYQAEGLAWMQFLREYGLNGILADDMGLGKTIQTLSHILLEKEAGRLTHPALVVAPTSLMGNWQSEAARFAPTLRVLVLTGPERVQRFGDIAQADLVLTSYALLPRDEDVLKEQAFHLLILDESQYIKNSRAKAAQTAGLLRANHRLCLTGTPVQNHLGELWSQFHFLMPGLLGDERGFNADFRKPIEKQGDGERNAFLIRRIKPFLLRRTKDSVAKELPPKTEMVRMVDLASAQRDLYETVRVAMDRKVRDEIARKGVARSQIVILDALLKLRQVCCDPRLLKAAGPRKMPPPSAKLEVLMELVDELLDEGRKLLVFSQFTSMLALIEAELQTRGVAYSLLTGDTVDRAAQVDAFQSGVTSVFLISLKAGGVGLNLTAADTVIHYDPWWNPAAENQATDRAWRIGQDKPVFVYRLIARGTLEEKIQELQRSKAGLADALLAGAQTQGLQIRPEDLLGILTAE